jgi:hypothetical protein
MGIGEWNVQMDEDRSASQDGLVYYGARRAISDVKKAKLHLLIFHEKYEAIRQVNASINASIQFCTQRTSAQNEVALFGEFLCPLYRCDGYLPGNYMELFEKRSTYLSVIQKKESKGTGRGELSKYAINEAHLQVKPVWHHVYGSDSQSYFVSEGKISSLALALSPLLGKSRQSLEKTIKNANITIERNLALAVLEMMNKSFDVPR